MKKFLLVLLSLVLVSGCNEDHGGPAAEQVSTMPAHHTCANGMCSRN